MTPEGFRVGIHRPSYTVANLRQGEHPFRLGEDEQGRAVENRHNFPGGDVEEPGARIIYEIRNPLFFRGATFIDSGWAAARAADPSTIGLKRPPKCSLRETLIREMDEEKAEALIRSLDRPLLCDLAQNSTDGRELEVLAQSCAEFLAGPDGRPVGLRYERNEKGEARPRISDFELFETVANNPYLAEDFRQVMVLRPGVQGGSEIVGDFLEGKSHVFEYLRRNSYIPWGHFAANMAHDAIRYRIDDLSETDMTGLRHLYYQRTYVSLGERFGIGVDTRRRRLDPEELEELRLRVLAAARRLEEPGPVPLWGWNFGYDYSGSGCRLHASHQMIHQQYALVPARVETVAGGFMPAYGAGDLVAAGVAAYQERYGRDFFADYLRAIRRNRRPDGRDLPDSLVVYEDDSVMVFVPKAQVSQWELQLMVLADTDDGPVGNVLEADSGVRRALDRGILMAQRILARLGARMVTSIEYPRRLGVDNGQRLLYSFLPKLPWSMGAFSEAQLRFICGHFPEDFARACRARLDERGEHQKEGS